jgi:predicted chitinase
MEAADSDRRAPRKPSMYGDWDDEAHMGSGEDTDNDGWVHAQQGAVKARSSE